MPSDRFYKLNAEKRDRILDAARHEFASCAFEKVSINRIVKNADISRGSFYTYFADTRDVIQTIFKIEADKGNKQLREFIIKNKGDYYKALLECIAVYSSEECSDEIKTNMAIARNSGLTFDIANHDNMSSFMALADNSDPNEGISWLREHLDPEIIDLSMSDEELLCLVISTVSNEMFTLMHIYMVPEKREEMYRMFAMFLRFVQYGSSPHEAGNRHLGGEMRLLDVTRGTGDTVGTDDTGHNGVCQPDNIKMVGEARRNNLSNIRYMDLPEEKKG